MHFLYIVAYLIFFNPYDKFLFRDIKVFSILEPLNIATNYILNINVYYLCHGKRKNKILLWKIHGQSYLTNAWNPISRIWKFYEDWKLWQLLTTCHLIYLSFFKIGENIFHCMYPFFILAFYFLQFTKYGVPLLWCSIVTWIRFKSAFNGTSRTIGYLLDRFLKQAWVVILKPWLLIANTIYYH